MNGDICLATNYLLLTGAARQMWIDFDRHLRDFDSRLVLLSTAQPETPLPFPVISVPFLLREYARLFPGAGGAGGCVSASDFELLEADCVRSNHAYPPGEALKGLLACRQVVATVLENLQPGYVLTWDATSPLALILQALAREAGLPVQGIERGLLPETMLIDSRCMQGWSDLRTHWLAQDMPAFDAAAYEQIRSYYVSRKPQKYGQPEFGGGGPALRQQLGLEGKKVVVFFGHYDACGLSSKNSNQRRYHSPGFDSTADALLALAGWLARHPDAAVVFKPHPLDFKPYPVAATPGLQVVRDLNVHALIDLADVVVTLFTSLQFEATLYDKPIVLLGRSAWWGRNATYEADCQADVPEMLAAALNRQDWNTRRSNAQAFVTWMMQQYLIGCTDTAPTRRNLRDFAQFIAKTSLDARGLPSPEARWGRFLAAIDALKSTVVRAPADRPAIPVLPPGLKPVAGTRPLPPPASAPNPASGGVRIERPLIFNRLTKGKFMPRINRPGTNGAPPPANPGSNGHNGGHPPGSPSSNGHNGKHPPQ